MAKHEKPLKVKGSFIDVMKVAAKGKKVPKKKPKEDEEDDSVNSPK